MASEAMVSAQVFPQPFWLNRFKRSQCIYGTHITKAREVSQDAFIFRRMRILLCCQAPLAEASSFMQRCTYAGIRSKAIASAANLHMHKAPHELRDHTVHGHPYATSEAPAKRFETIDPQGGAFDNAAEPCWAERTIFLKLMSAMA